MIKLGEFMSVASLAQRDLRGSAYGGKSREQIEILAGNLLVM
jgi:hypothetical protein